jgi:hypothetical protein
MRVEAEPRWSSCGSSKMRESSGFLSGLFDTLHTLFSKFGTYMYGDDLGKQRKGQAPGVLRVSEAGGT